MKKILFILGFLFAAAISFGQGLISLTTKAGETVSYNIEDIKFVKSLSSGSLLVFSNRGKTAEVTQTITYIRDSTCNAFMLLTENGVQGLYSKNHVTQISRTSTGSKLTMKDGSGDVYVSESYATVNAQASIPIECGTGGGGSGSYSFITTDSFTTFRPAGPIPDSAIVLRTTTGNTYQKIGPNFVRVTYENGQYASTIFNVSSDTLTFDANLNNRAQLSLPTSGTTAHIAAPTNIASQAVGEVFMIGIQNQNDSTVTVTWNSIFGKWDGSAVGITEITAGSTVNFLFQTVADGLEGVILRSLNDLGGSGGTEISSAFYNGSQIKIVESNGDTTSIDIANVVSGAGSPVGSPGTGQRIYVNTTDSTLYTAIGSNWVELEAGTDVAALPTATAFKAADRIVRTDSTGTFGELTNQLRDSTIFSAATYADIAKISTTLKAGDRIKVKDTGAEYLVQSDSVTSYVTDGIAVINLGSSKFANLQPTDHYKYSWFKSGGEDDNVTLQRAFDYAYYNLNDTRNLSTGVKIKTNSASGVIYQDRNLTLKDSVRIFEGLTLKGDFNYANDANFRCNTVFLDLNNAGKAGITFERYPGAGATTSTYVGAKINGIRFSALTPSRAAIFAHGAMGHAVDNVMVSGNNLVVNGIETWHNVFAKFSNIRVEDVTGYGFFHKKIPGSISTTSFIENFTSNTALNGVRIESGSTNSLTINNSVVENTSGVAYWIGKNNIVYLNNLYAETIPATATSTAVAVVQVGIDSSAVSSGNSILHIKNGKIQANPSSPAIITGVLADSIDVLSVEGLSFSGTDTIFSQRNGVVNTKWGNNNEGGGGEGVKTHTAINLTNAGILKPTRVNIFNTRSNIYDNFTSIGVLNIHDKIGVKMYPTRLPLEILGSASFGSSSLNSGTTVTIANSSNVPTIFGLLRDGTDYSALALRTGSGTGIHMTTGNIVGIGTTTPASSAIMDIVSATKGFLIPRMTTTQRNAISTPATGLQVYDTSDNELKYYNGSAWRAVVDSTTADITYFKNGGNSFGSTATLGTNDEQSLTFETLNEERLTIDTSGNLSSGTLSNVTLSGGNNMVLVAGNIFGVSSADTATITATNVASMGLAAARLHINSGFSRMYYGTSNIAWQINNSDGSWAINSPNSNTSAFVMNDNGAGTYLKYDSQNDWLQLGNNTASSVTSIESDVFVIDNVADTAAVKVLGTTAAGTVTEYKPQVTLSWMHTASLADTVAWSSSSVNGVVIPDEYNGWQVVEIAYRTSSTVADDDLGVQLAIIDTAGSSTGGMAGTVAIGTRYDSVIGSLAVDAGDLLTTQVTAGTPSATGLVITVVLQKN